MYLPSVTVRSLVLWGLGGAGVVALALLGAQGDRAARWALAFLGWALVAALWSGQPGLSFFAAYGADRGWVFLASCLGCWALGRRRSQAGGEILIAAIVVGLAANALVAVVQATVDGVELFALSDGRASGFTDNPIFLGALMGGGMALGAALAVRSHGRWWVWLVLITGATAVANLSGSRIGLVAGAVVALIASATRNLRRTVAVAAAIALGVCMSLVVLDAAATERVEGDQISSGLTPRSLMWRAGLDAAAERPVVGWGPGRFQQATGSRTTARYVLAEGPDRLFAEAHNEAVEILVTTGVPGLLLAAGFVWAVATGDRRARGPLAWFTLAVVATWVLQPTSASTAPIALLALGYAGSGERDAKGPRAPALRAVFISCSVIGAAVGLVIGARLVASDRDVRTAMDEGSPEAIERAASRFPADPYIANLRAFVLFQDALIDGSPARERAALSAAEHLVDLDDTQANSWVRLGMAQAAFGPGDDAGDQEAARRSFERALEESPWSVFAMQELWRLERRAGNADAAAAWADRLCRVEACPSD